MKDLNERKERYLRDPLPVRMGGLAANLARVGSFVSFPKGKTAVGDLLFESKYFVEWTAAEFELETTVELVDLQRKLVRWHRNIDRLWNDDNLRTELGAEARKISERLIERSGLANK